MLALLIILLIVSAVFGGWGNSRFGYAGWSPLGIILVIFLVLFFMGGLHLGGPHSSYRL